MSTQAEGGQSSRPMYATKGKKKGKGKQKTEYNEESEDGIVRWKRRERIARLHELLPPCSTSDAYELVKLVGDFYHAEAFEMQKRSRSTTSNISQNANDFFMDSMSNVSSLIEWACGDLQLPDTNKLLEGDECWHCGRKDDEGGGRRRGEGAAAQAVLDADPYPLPSEFDLVDPGAPGVIEAVIARAMAEDEDLQQQQEGILYGRQDMEEAIEEGEEYEAMGGENTSQAAQSCSDKEEAGNDMGAVEDIYGAEDSKEAMTLDQMDAGEEETLVGENQRLTREVETLREELGKANELNKDLQTKLDVTQEELDQRDQNFDEPRNNMVIALKQISAIKRQARNIQKDADDLPISHQVGIMSSPREKAAGRRMVIQSGPGPCRDKVWKDEINRLRRQVTSLLSSVKDSETALRRQYLIILKRYRDKSQAKRDHRSLSRLDMEVETEPGEPWIEYPDTSENTETDRRQDQTAAVGGRVRETVDLQLEIVCLENAGFLHANRIGDTDPELDRMDDIARFRARHVEMTGSSELGHVLIPVIPHEPDLYVGVTNWLDVQIDKASRGALLPSKGILDRSSFWQWPEVRLAVYSWAFYTLSFDFWFCCDEPTHVGLRPAIWDIYFHARDGLSPELRERYSTAHLFGVQHTLTMDDTTGGIHGSTQ